MKYALVMLSAAVVAACASSSRTPGPSSAGDVAARVGDRTITVAELDEQWRQNDPTEHADATFKVYTGRRKALDEILAGQLFAEAAKTQGLSPEAYEEAELSKRVTEVTDADVISFYKSNTDQMQGQSLENMAAPIARFLTLQRQDEARAALVAELRKNGPRVEVSLEAPRYDVAVSEDDPSFGDSDADVTIVEFSDYQCPYCRQAVPVLKRVQETYGDRVRIVWKDYPLTRIHPLAAKAAEAAHCAGEQKQYWAYHDRLFERQEALALDDLRRHARELSLDMPRFNACVDSGKYAVKVSQGLEAGNRLGVSSTPTLFVNGRVMPGAYPYEDIVAVVDEELARR
jgi:protein-disulfide isomerase